MQHEMRSWMYNCMHLVYKMDLSKSQKSEKFMRKENPPTQTPAARI